MNVPVQSNGLMGLLAAVFWGGGDFSGGMGAQHAGGSLRAALRVILLSHLCSLCILVALGLLRSAPFPHGHPIGWSLAAGITGGVSLACFYIALARGSMGASAAMSGLLAAAVPAVFAISSQGSPGVLRLVGFGIAGVAVWMVAASPAGVLEPSATASASSTTGLAIFAGVGFGLYFIALKMAGSGGIIWPMALARVGSLTTCSSLLLGLSLTRSNEPNSRPQTSVALMPKKAVFWALSTAVLDTCGNLLYISATRTGRLDVAAVLASLYPVTTILLAGIVLKERLSRRQGFGMVMATAAVIMITV